MKKYLLSLFFLVCLFIARGQGGMISLSTSYNMPLGEMDWSYKAAPGVQLSGMFTNDSRRWTTGLGMGIGYVKFNAIADTLYYVVDKGGVGGAGLGKAYYSPYTILQLSALLTATRKLSKKLGMEFGLAVAYYYGKRDIEFTDEFGGADGLSELTTKAALVPKVGLSYSLTDRWQIAPFVSYALMIEVGSTDTQAIDYNADTGKTLSFYSTGIALNYHF